jgi:hypothetical protein
MAIIPLTFYIIMLDQKVILTKIIGLNSMGQMLQGI